MKDTGTPGGSTREGVAGENEEKGELGGFGLLEDRSGGRADYGVPADKVFPLVRLTVPAYRPEECPLCKKGVPITERGSHHLKK